MFYNKYSLYVQLHNKFCTPGRRVAESSPLVVPCIRKYCMRLVPACLSFFSPLIKIND